ncbi:MAG: response regulator [Candidatus Eremiobacterota bacterium]
MSKKVILLVEDNPDDELLTMRALKKNNVMNDIVVCRNGVEAIDYLFGKNDNEADLPQLILLDLKLPKIDGLEVLRKIRSTERTRFLPVVVLTSSKEERDIVESYKLGANSYIQKPVDFSQFVEAVKQLQLYWLVMNVSPVNMK